MTAERDGWLQWSEAKEQLVAASAALLKKKEQLQKEIAEIDKALATGSGPSPTVIHGTPKLTPKGREKLAAFSRKVRKHKRPGGMKGDSHKVRLALAGAANPLSPADVADLTGLPLPEVHRRLNSLRRRKEAYAVPVEGGRVGERALWSLRKRGRTGAALVTMSEMVLPEAHNPAKSYRRRRQSSRAHPSRAGYSGAQTSIVHYLTAHPNASLPEMALALKMPEDVIRSRICNLLQSHPPRAEKTWDNKIEDLSPQGKRRTAKWRYRMLFPKLPGAPKGSHSS